MVISQTLRELHVKPPSSIGEPMIGENRQLVTYELVKFETYLIENQDCRKITDHFRGIYRSFPKRTGGCQQVTVWTCKH